MNIVESRVDAWAVAARHPIRRQGPAVSFTSGAILGNGGLGAIVKVRPDAILVHFGHNAVWDVRLAENEREAIGTFREVFERVAAIGKDDRCAVLEDDPWYASYLKLSRCNYAERYPRPFPCGSLVLGFDRRRCESLGYELDIREGRCRVDLIRDGEAVAVHLVVDPDSDRLWIHATGPDGSPRQPFERIHLLPDPQTPKEFPARQTWSDVSEVGFTQVLPRVTEPGRQVPGPDRHFRLLARLPGARLTGSRWPSIDLARAPFYHEMGPLERRITETEALVVVVDLDQGDGPTPVAPRNAPEVTNISSAFADLDRRLAATWGSYWACSGVALADAELEAIWYRNHYFLRCSVRPGTTCPGLFANWSYAEIGSRWHGDYHMNYNTQQPFWVTFSSNRLDYHLPYVEIVEHATPMAKSWARDYYGLRGAYYPHSFYPVDMTMNPYPVPTWGWEICETPWTVQSLWWHYRYSRDLEFIRNRAFMPLREASRFLADYLMRPEATGDRWNDDRCHIFPSVPPETYGLRKGFDKNYDIHIDITLTRFVWGAFREACVLLGREGEEAELLGDIASLWPRLPDLPTAETPQGTVTVAAPGDDPEIVQNVPVAVANVFPGEEVGLLSDPESLAMARRSFAIQQCEGGNELVFQNLQAARLGMLDLERFKRQVAYCTTPGGSCADLILQGKGRYHDHTPFDAMEPMGIWFENFALPVVINECLLQSHDGVIHLFPHWPSRGDAAFRTLRAVGAFLVSASMRNGQIDPVVIESEKGGTCEMVNPWPKSRVRLDDGQLARVLDATPRLRFDTVAGGRYRLEPL